MRFPSPAPGEEGLNRFYEYATLARAPQRATRDQQQHSLSRPTSDRTFASRNQLRLQVPSSTIQRRLFFILPTKLRFPYKQQTCAQLCPTRPAKRSFSSSTWNSFAFVCAPVTFRSSTALPLLPSPTQQSTPHDRRAPSQRCIGLKGKNVLRRV
jgi:hypothetical protein